MLNQEIISNFKEKKRSSAVNVKHVVYIILVFTVVTGCFKFIYWDNFVWNPIIKIAGVCMLVYAASYRVGNYAHFSGFVVFFAIYPWITILTSSYFYNQEFTQSIRTLLFTLVWFSYFIIHKISPSESSIIRGFLIISFIILSIQVIQQFTYPHAYFGILSDEELLKSDQLSNVEIRNGIYRFRLPTSAYFTMIPLLHYFHHIRKKISWKYIIIVAMMITSIYLTLTRQAMIACAVVLVLSIFNQKSIFNIRYLLIGIILCWIGIEYYDLLFGSFSETTKDELNDDYIRVLAYNFYWDKIVSSPLSFLFGCGAPSTEGPYAELYRIWSKVWHFHIVDVGIIGYWFEYGLLYVVAFFSINYILIFYYRHNLPKYLILLVIYALIQSPMIFPFQNVICYLYWPFILYLADLHISNSKLKPFLHGHFSHNSQLQHM